MFGDQTAFSERFAWGEEGLRRLAPHADIVVVVDVLSFATAVDVAVGRGAIVYPYPERGDPAAVFARQVDAILASDRSTEHPASPFSLSPVSLLNIPPGARLVLPSPNGATLVSLAAKYTATVLVGCLRNATVVATACRALGDAVAVIAAGERWRYDQPGAGPLRPAVEDLVGAGSILAAFLPTHPSPEAIAAIAAFHAAAHDLDAFLRDCVSGNELIARGFASDVTVAARHDVSQTVPYFRDGALAAWTAPAH